MRQTTRSLYSSLGMIALVVALAGCASQTASPSYGTPATSSSMAPMAGDARTDLAKAMRELWADHVIWTRAYIVSAAAGQPDADVVSRRLLANQEHIGQAIVPYYGQAAGNRLTALLKDHILIAVDLVTAAKAGNQAAVRDADRRWHGNAEDIASFLSGANPNWSRGALLAMLNEHLALTTREATARLQGDFAADVAAFDTIFDQAMMMADALTDGIVKQFPDRFRM